MESVCPVALLGWMPIVCCLFLLLPKQSAVLVSFLAGWLFLPVVSIPIQGFLDYDKRTAISLGVLMAALLFDADRSLWKVRPSKMDIPAIVWCVCPLASSLSNDLGIYDGMASVVDQVVTWGVPYIFGRAYFESADGVGRMSISIFLSGLVYAPLCLYEIRMSPQLHKVIYGMHQHSFGQNLRFGGWRPTVFLQHGLAVGMWMTTASVIGFVLLTSGALRSVWVFPMSWVVVLVTLTSLLCKSTGSIILLFVGYVAYLLSLLLKSRAIVVVMICIVALYLTVRVAGRWTAEELITLSRELDADRSQSLKTRLENENLLVEKAMMKPVLGWGRWGRSRIYNDDSQDISITDSKWIIAMGESGLVGLISFFSMLLLPIFSTIIRISPRTWNDRKIAPMIGLSICLALYSMDNLLNAMFNPVFMLIAGALVSNPYKSLDHLKCTISTRTALSFTAGR